MQLIEFRPEGIFCPAGGFYVDPWRPVDLALITHGHGDHARRGMKKYLCHHTTVPILQSRIGTDIQVQGIAYNETLTINGVNISFHPAGHIIGSAQIRMECKGKVAVVSGDYKLQEDGLSTPFELVKCHEFVTESTFGLPIYQWNTVGQQNRELAEWVALNKTNKRTSVFIGYSLGKAQRIMKALDGIAPIHVHYSIDKLNRAYLGAGITLPDYHLVDFSEDVKHLNGDIVIVPPALLDSNILKKIPNMAFAICSGWMTVRGTRRWRSADAGFAISDHADWNELLEVVKKTQAENVYVTHGQTSIFSRYLNEIGINAQQVSTQFNAENDDIDSQIPAEK